MNRKMVLAAGGEDGMWHKAFRFFGLPYEAYDAAAFDGERLSQAACVILPDIGQVGSGAAAALLDYVQSGGGMLACGQPSEAFGAAFGIKAGPDGGVPGHHCLKITGQGLGGFTPGDLLLFTNYNFRADETAPLLHDGTRYRELARLTPLQQCGPRLWREAPGATGATGATGGTPGLLYGRIGSGTVAWLATPAGSLNWVEQPEVPSFTEYPSALENLALIRFIGVMLHYAAPSLQLKPLWPEGAKAVVCITGDVHDYEGIEGRFDREHRDMLYNCDLLKSIGLEGKATFFVSGIVAQRHPEAIKEAVGRGYEIAPHTWRETQYLIENWTYEQQHQDIRACIDAFTLASPGYSGFRSGFRTHGYQSNLATRDVLEQMGYRYLADLQAWEVCGEDNPGLPEGSITYLALPQRAAGRRGRPLNLLEIPDTVANDHFLYRIMGKTPADALDFWKKSFDLCYRTGGLFQTCWHPYISIQEGEGREAAYRSLFEYILGHKDVLFMQMGSLCDWWIRRNS